jgi:hypothetical protein
VAPHYESTVHDLGSLDELDLDEPGEVEAPRARPSPRRTFERLAPWRTSTAKRARIRRLARSWMSGRGSAAGFRSVGLDAIGVTLSPRGRVLGLEHVEAAF